MRQWTRIAAACAASWIIQAPIAIAQDVRLTEDTLARTIDIGGQVVSITRNQDQTAQLSGDFTKTSRPCPPFCISEMEAAPGVTTVGELELIDFIETRVARGTGLLIDSRLPDWFGKGTIPGAVNVPFSTLEPTNPYRDDILLALGARQGSGQRFDFSDARDLLMFCNGPWCDQSPRAIRNLVDAGYPAEKLFYYRGGMQTWLLLGLTVIDPQTQG